MYDKKYYCILLNYPYEKDPGIPWESAEPPWDLQGRPGHAPGTSATSRHAPGTPPPAPGIPVDPGGPPQTTKTTIS